jgi:hypothetical protein
MSTPGVWTDGRTRATGLAWVVFVPGRFIPPQCRFCDVAKVAMIEKEDLARSGYKINMRVIFKKNPFYISD